MANILFRTRTGNPPTKGQPRVYFTCHPEDRDRFLDQLAADVFRTHDCAIYYTEDMAEPIPEENLETDLGQMNLFIVPVTYKLLRQPNRAMDGDLAYAKEHHIPILPFMMEPGIDELYSQKDKFGERQYLNPNSTDATEIAYEEKLKKYLESVLISDELANRVRAAFDAYIFLSYRKKDRRYANELMKLIHRHPEYRDIAIWYDEFLTPGESFAESIQKALEKSQLFTLLVTPNLLEEPGGKPNFVMAEEYPAAVQADKTILPAEMVATDRAALAEKFPSIPECADPRDAEAFQARLLQAIETVAISANNDDPEHNFLIGLAYLEGIDVEVNRDRGIELITMAAEAELPEAMEKLYDLYATTWFDFRKEKLWAERVFNFYLKQNGENHADTMQGMYNLALTCIRCGDYTQAVMLLEKVYLYQCDTLGDEHPETLKTLQNIAFSARDVQYSLKLYQKVYAAQCRILGAEDPDTLESLKGVAKKQTELGLSTEAIQTYERLLECQSHAFGHEDPITLNHLASIYEKNGEQERANHLWERSNQISEANPDDWYNAKELKAMLDFVLEELEDGAFDEPEEVQVDFLDEDQQQISDMVIGYSLCCALFGEEDPQTMRAAEKLADAYLIEKEYGKTMQHLKQIYQVKAKQLGENHPETVAVLEKLYAAVAQAESAALTEHIDTVEMLVEIYEKQKEANKTLYLYQLLHMLRVETLGEDHEDALKALGKLSSQYIAVTDYQKAAETRARLIAIKGEKYGKDSKNLCFDQLLLAAYYQQMGEYAKAIEMLNWRYQIVTKHDGETAGSALGNLHMLAVCYVKANAYKKAEEILCREYTLRCKTQGEEHKDTLQAKSTLEYVREKL